ncbi:hypothetical protein [Marinobacter salsuginis]|uniref:hypothetical protein n=1 Tax=Marinobacter salsuginis TaxID=418719 RepID=UPI00273FEBE1|nr:hypothetical protein [Marinobacter salsuginis]
MQVQMTGTLTGAKRVDFEKYQHVNLFVAVGVKNGDGTMSQQMRYEPGFNRYEEVKAMIGKTVKIDAELVTKDGRDQSLSVIALSPVATANKAG